MRVEVKSRFTSRLPSPDPHPYRTGAWTPNTVEVDAFDLDVIDGKIPDDLRGVYLRNTENPLFPAISGRYHPFDGDGMLHAIRFDGGKAHYRNRFVRTQGLAAELEANAPLWAGILEPASLSLRDGWGARTRMKDASSTDVVVHAGRALTTFYQCGDAYVLDPVTLETRGVAPLSHPSFARGATISAHAKVDPRTGELLFFNYSAEPPYCHVGIASRNGELVRVIPVPLPGPRLPHDMAFTTRFAIIGDFPLFWDPARLAQGVHRASYHPELGSRFGLVPRDGASDAQPGIRWFTFAPTYVLHFTNAYEEGDWVIVEGYHQAHPVPERAPDDTPITVFMKSLDMNAMTARHHRWKMNLATGETREEQLDDECSEFPTIHDAFAGRRHRYVYAALGEPGMFLFRGFVKTDTRTGAKTTFELPKGVFASEAAFCPRLRGSGASPDEEADEDDGYLITFTIDVNADASECLLFDAQELDRGPVARIRLPMRISSGTHATWGNLIT